MLSPRRSSAAQFAGRGYRTEDETVGQWAASNSGNHHLRLTTSRSWKRKHRRIISCRSSSPRRGRSPAFLSEWADRKRSAPRLIRAVRVVYTGAWHGAGPEAVILGIPLLLPAVRLRDGPGSPAVAAICLPSWRPAQLKPGQGNHCRCAAVSENDLDFAVAMDAVMASRSLITATRTAISGATTSAGLRKRLCGEWRIIRTAGGEAGLIGFG